MLTNTTNWRQIESDAHIRRARQDIANGLDIDPIPLVVVVDSLLADDAFRIMRPEGQGIGGKCPMCGDRVPAGAARCYRCDLGGS